MNKNACNPTVGVHLEDLVKHKCLQTVVRRPHFSFFWCDADLTLVRPHRALSVVGKAPQLLLFLFFVIVYFVDKALVCVWLCWLFRAKPRAFDFVSTNPVDECVVGR